MESTLSRTDSQDVVKFYWILALAQVIHSIEEISTHLYLKFGSMSEALHKAISFIPVFKLSSDLFAVINILMITLLLGAITGVGRNAKWAIALAWLWAVVEVANGLFHISTWLWLGKYFPGGFSGPILLILGLLLIQKLIKAKS